LVPKQIATYNALSLDKGLGSGQIIKVPLQTANFSQNGLQVSGESLVPVYHIILPKEWLYHISMEYNNVPVLNLEKWNHTSPEQAHAGMPLIVGFLRVRTSQSALAKAAFAPTATTDPGIHPDYSAPPANLANNKPDTRSDNPPAANQENKPLYVSSGNHPAGGYFRVEYNEGTHTLAGQAGTFKSTSGWQDGKYYALLNSAPVGTIVRISSQASGKSVYAKVLGQLPEMKESSGLLIRLSNAASAELGTGEGRFAVEIKY
jgi:hypothetical protein